MEYRILGKTGLRVSRLGFGGIPIQRIDAQDTRELLLQLRENGINYIDTARGYTVSESYLGSALEGMREDFILATKSMARDKAGVLADIDRSLENLRTDYIDLYQCHNPSVEELAQITAPGGALEGLLEARQAGKLRHIGLTAHSLAVFEQALEMDWVESFMFPYNIVESQGAELMARCREKNIGFVCMKPLAGGAIEDATLALRYIAANDCVDVVIPGMAEPKEITQNAAALGNTAPLCPQELEKIAAIRERLGTQFCRRCNYCAPCSAGISISQVFLLEGYLTRYGLEDWARTRYAGMAKKAEDCISCGLCEGRCPYGLPIVDMMHRCAEKFGA